MPLGVDYFDAQCESKHPASLRTDEAGARIRKQDSECSVSVRRLKVVPSNTKGLQGMSKQTEKLADITLWPALNPSRCAQSKGRR